MESIAGRVILLWGWRRSLTAFLAGAVAVLAQAPYDFFPAGFISFTVLVWLLDGATSDRGDGRFRRLRTWFGIGWWFGFGYFVFGLWWIGQALLVDAEEFAWALPLAVLGLPAGLAVFYGVATALSRLCWPDGLGRIIAIAAGFGLAEWLRAVALSGFPWNAIGYAAMPVPLLMQSVSLVGLYGMNVLAVFLFCLPALVVSDRHRLAGLVAGLLLTAIHVGYGYHTLRQAPPDMKTLAVRIVQPSVPQGGKWDPAFRDEILRNLIQLSSRAPASGSPVPSLIVWPETALPFLLTDRPDALAAIGEMLSPDQTLLLGAVRSEGAGEAEASVRYYNSVVAIDGAGEIIDAVDKVHLVPFGEFLPFQDLFSRAGLRAVADSVGGFSAAAERRPILLADGISALPLICYEIIFPAEVVARSADFIVNVTNDAWFGNTPGPFQHFRQAQVRAVETAMPLVRSANNGISAVVDAQGRIIDAFALDAVGSLDAELRIPAQGIQTSWNPQLNGILIILFFAILACGMNVIARIRSR